MFAHSVNVFFPITVCPDITVLPSVVGSWMYKAHYGIVRRNEDLVFICSSLFMRHGITSRAIFQEIIVAYTLGNRDILIHSGIFVTEHSRMPFRKLFLKSAQPEERSRTFLF